MSPVIPKMAVLAAVLSGSGCVGTAPRAPITHESTAQMGVHLAAGFDDSAIATAIATHAAAVQVGDLVRIAGGAEDVAFMERIGVAVAAQGGHPLVTVFSGATLRRWYEQVPTHFDTMRDEWLWRISQSADVEIRVGALGPDAYAGVAPARLDAWERANAAAGALRRERDVRTVYVGNGLHPSEWRARMLGVERIELERIFVDGLTADPALLAATGAPLRQILRGASSVRVLHPNGTDLTVGVAGTRVVLSDGTTMPPPRRAGAEDELNITWLPAGEVTLGLDPERADGRLVIERVFLDGETLGPVTLSYSGGQLVALESEADLSALREYLGLALPLSERLTGLKFGLNPRVTDLRVLPLMGAGMVSLSIGRNIELGGDIDLPFLVFLTLAGTTVEVDGRVVVENGVLKP